MDIGELRKEENHFKTIIENERASVRLSCGTRLFLVLPANPLQSPVGALSAALRKATAMLPARRLKLFAHPASRYCSTPRAPVCSSCVRGDALLVATLLTALLSSFLQVKDTTLAQECSALESVQRINLRVQCHALCVDLRDRHHAPMLLPGHYFFVCLRT